MLEVKEEQMKAMEQQTISITKAGGEATLNARESLLTAANHIGGCYEKRKSQKQNVDMSAPLMSKFDLLFIIMDDCNEVTDHDIAKRIIDQHTKLKKSVGRATASLPAPPASWRRPTSTTPVMVD